jgi:homogentisate 1,2-dioxygenase
MWFWHPDIDYNEVIICVRGALRRETEMGAVILKEGELSVIRKGISTVRCCASSPCQKIY